MCVRGTGVRHAGNWLGARAYCLDSASATPSGAPGMRLSCATRRPRGASPGANSHVKRVAPR
eukprot:6325070-Alexandrium_andersonii.AAC.1